MHVHGHLRRSASEAVVKHHVSGDAVAIFLKARVFGAEITIADHEATRSVGVVKHDADGGVGVVVAAASGFRHGASSGGLNRRPCLGNQSGAAQKRQNGFLNDVFHWIWFGWIDGFGKRKKKR